MKRISVIVPSYNHSQYIEACLDSIYFQDYENLEIIIVDDCSTDDSVEVIERWIDGLENDVASHAAYFDDEKDVVRRREHKRYDKSRTVTFMRNSQNMGSTGTYNRGFKAATGEYCAFVVSDDICHPQMFSALAKPLDSDEADFTYCDMFVVDDQMRIMREFILPEYDFEACFCGWYLCGVATLYRRSLHERFGYYDESAMADDHECYLRFAMNGARFKRVPKTMYSVRSHHNREVGLHGKERFEALLGHSKELCMKARKWIGEQI